jgi:hypothetical protein
VTPWDLTIDVGHSLDWLGSTTHWTNFQQLTKALTIAAIQNDGNRIGSTAHAGQHRALDLLWECRHGVVGDSDNSILVWKERHARVVMLRRCFRGCDRGSALPKVKFQDPLAADCAAVDLGRPELPVPRCLQSPVGEIPARSR